MKLTAAFLALFEDASAVVDPGPRTNDDTAYGDIVFSGCQLDRLQLNPRIPAGLNYNHDGSECGSPLDATFPKWDGYQNPDNDQYFVPYVFNEEYDDSEFGGYEGWQSSSAIRWKLSEMNNVLNVKFVEIAQNETDIYPDHIEIVSEENDDFLSACASYIGRIGGKQKWFMRPDCAFHDYSSVNHYAMYILGFGPASSTPPTTFHESLIEGGNANYHFLQDLYMRIADFDGGSVSNLLVYKLEDGEWSMKNYYYNKPMDRVYVRDFPVSEHDIALINSYYIVDNNPCENGDHQCSPG